MIITSKDQVGAAMAMLKPEPESRTDRFGFHVTTSTTYRLCWICEDTPEYYPISTLNPTGRKIEELLNDKKVVKIWIE